MYTPEELIAAMAFGGVPYAYEEHPMPSFAPMPTTPYSYSQPIDGNAKPDFVAANESDGFGRSPYFVDFDGKSKPEIHHLNSFPEEMQRLKEYCSFATGDCSDCRCEREKDNDDFLADMGDSLRPKYKM